MGQKDIVEKNLEDYNDVFADIVNVLVFEGERVIRSRELKALKVRSQYKADSSKLHEEERDNAKYWSGGKVKLPCWVWKTRRIRIRICRFGSSDMTAPPTGRSCLIRNQRTAARC